jgi:vacuolar-type H+-ATPase subunit I/STV1
MDEIKESIDDLIEETCLRALTDDQVEKRVRRFTELCEQLIRGRIENQRKRQILLDRLEIMKCFYNHSSVQKVYGSGSAKEIGESQRNKRLENIVRRRRLALQMIEKTDPETAIEIQKHLETELIARPEHRHAQIQAPVQEIPSKEPLTNSHWFFLYFNLLLLAGLVAAVLSLVR